ncbi:cell surface protein [Paraliomyxa miuraensis]|uniref:cell surface protein n=1 Tax=Paraliomyxa miuraensis TaxID=376150 RepID=UPI00224D1CC5|nr:cell surface protein [Paraliomyxa miuraensis]MCX4245446.1 cell surface protein [Paraliomyxa miuraensis]
MKRRWHLVARGGGLGLSPLLITIACTDPDLHDDHRAPVEGICGPESGPADPFADCVESFDPAPEVSFGHDAMPQIVLGAPVGGGIDMGSTDVASLGCGGSITLWFDDPWPTDGPGPDLLVFENAFEAGSITFIEPAQVLVSEDGHDWHAFPCEPDGGPTPPDGCAGLRPVLATTPEPALDPTAAGGDAFDLAELGLSEIRYLRLVDRTAEHYDSDTWCLGPTGGFDLDAVAVLGVAP